MNLLVNLIKDNAVGKEVYVNWGNDCYFRQNNGMWIPFPVLDLSHCEADQVILMHAVYAGSGLEDTICIVADDTDIYLSLIHVSHEIKSNIFFRQGKIDDKDGMFHDVKSIADTLGPEICQFCLVFTPSQYLITHPPSTSIQKFKFSRRCWQWVIHTCHCNQCWLKHLWLLMSLSSFWE